MRIVYLDLDSLSPSHLSCYGYPRQTSPAIDALATEGTRFTGVYCSDAPCLPSRTAMYSGRFGIQTGVVGHGGTAAEPKRQGPTRSFCDAFVDFGLVGRLQKAGHHTAVISPFAQRHAAHWFYAGFNEAHNTGKGGQEIADEVTPVVEKWLGDNASREHWYLHINYWDPHTPYRTPMAFGNPFDDEPPLDWLTDEVLAKHQKLAGPHTALDLGMYQDDDPIKWPRTVPRLSDRAALNKWMDGYDVGIRYADAHIARIVALLQRLGVYDDTMIIVSADHGENQGELGIYGEHATADHGTCHVPLIVKGPNIARGVVDTGLHYQLDWAPTLMDLLGLPKPEIWDGISFAPSLAGSASSGREQLVISHAAHTCQRSVRWDRWLYIHTFHDGFHLFPREMIFDLAADPQEQNDLAATRPELLREGAWRLANWTDEQMQTMARRTSDVADPLWTVIAEGGPFHARLLPGADITWFSKYLLRLEGTGRADGAAALRAKYLKKI